MSSRQAPTTSEIALLPMKILRGYARTLNVFQSKADKVKLCKLVLDNWSLSGDLATTLEQDLKHLESNKSKSATKTKITNQLKKWVSETQDQELTVEFPVVVGNRVGTDGENNPIWGFVSGRFKVTFATLAQVEGMLVSIEKEDSRLPRTGRALTFVYKKATPKSSIPGTKPTYFCPDYAGHIVTPYDSHSVYSAEIYPLY